LLQIVKNLQAKSLSMKVDNERIIKAQEELNHALLSKIQQQENDKEKETNSDAETTSYKRNGKQQNFFDNEDNCSTDGTCKTKKKKSFKR